MARKRWATTAMAMATAAGARSTSDVQTSAERAIATGTELNLRKTKETHDGLALGHDGDGDGSRGTSNVQTSAERAIDTGTGLNLRENLRKNTINA